VLIIMSAFIICWVPFFILALAKSQHWVNYVPRWLDSLTLWLGYSNRFLFSVKNFLVVVRVT